MPTRWQRFIESKTLFGQRFVCRAFRADWHSLGGMVSGYECPTALGTFCLLLLRSGHWSVFVGERELGSFATAAHVLEALIQSRIIFGANIGLPAELVFWKVIEGAGE